jgi:hypothetical protein
MQSETLPAMQTQLSTSVANVMSFNCRMRHFNHLNCIRHLQTVRFCLRLWTHHLPGSHSHTCISAALQGESYTYHRVLLYDIFQTVLSDQTYCCLPTEGTFIAMQM